MVILGGLELVAAGVILHKYNKGKEQELEREQERRARERRHDRKHHHRRNSPPHRSRKESSAYPPQGQLPRPQSAPPPGYAPDWQPQPAYYPPQPWQPQQNDKTPAWQPQPNDYPPTWQSPLPSQSPSQSSSLPKPQSQLRMYPTSLHDDAALSELLQTGSAQATSQQNARLQPRPIATVHPGPDYAELSADSHRRHSTNPDIRPHVSFLLPGEESHNESHSDPPPAYRDYQP